MDNQFSDSTNDNKVTRNRMRKVKLLDLINAVDDGDVKGLIEPRDMWGGAHVIVICPEDSRYDIKNHIHDDLFVVTKNARMLAGLFYYVKDNIMKGRDFYFYALMGLLANDYIKQYGDPDDYMPLLAYVVEGINKYFHIYSVDSPNRNNKEFYIFIRGLLSLKTTDEEIKRMV